MPDWKLRSPDRFDPGFLSAIDRGRQALAQGSDEALIPMVSGLPSKQAAKVYADKFRWFRFNLREHPMHRLSYTEANFTLKTKARQSADGTWAVSLVMRPKEDLADLTALVGDTQKKG